MWKCCSRFCRLEYQLTTTLAIDYHVPLTAALEADRRSRRHSKQGSSACPKTLYAGITAIPTITKGGNNIFPMDVVVAATARILLSVQGSLLMKGVACGFALGSMKGKDDDHPYALPSVSL